jgi:alkylation response protein AidB-like acyl-CoA dehydrogenase
VTTTATRDDDWWRLTGLKPAVLDAHTADWVVVVARTDDRIGAFLVEGPDATLVPGLDPTRQLARIEFDGTPARRLGEGVDIEAAMRRVIEDAGIGLCAELVGACDASLALATDYAKVRVQFGRPIGTFQAIKHIAADMVAATTLARVGTHYAAWASDTETDDREVAAAMAKSYAAEAAIHVTADTIQIHGGVGFTWDCDAHLYYKRAKANDLMLGRQGWQRARVADLVLGPA